jgi:formylglycine-generating enzyme required for sulfatase activity
VKRYLMLILALHLLVGCGGEATPITAPPTDASIGDTWTRPTDGAVMVYVPAGEFLMGSTEDDPDVKGPRERPQHTVYLDAFWIDRTEVNYPAASCGASAHSSHSASCMASWSC